MIQSTNVQDPCRVQRCQKPAPIINSDYNAVKIAINGASVNAPAPNAPVQGGQMVYAGHQSQNCYSNESMPACYNYPQANLYDYPQAQHQAYYAPVEQLPFNYAPAAEDIVRNYCTCPLCGTVLPSKAITSEVSAVEVPQPQMVIQNPVAAPVIQPQVMQQNINSAVASAPAPVVTADEAVEIKDEKDDADEVAENTNAVKAEDAPKVEIKAPEELKPQIDLNAFIAELMNPDFDKQAVTMEAIALMVNQAPDKASELLDERVINALNGILTADTKDLIGPTKEQTEARIKIMQGKDVTDAEKELANTITPLEKAERNKSYALFTTAILDKLFYSEVEKLSGQIVPFKDLPGITGVVDQMSANPNPMVRVSAIEALSYVQRPEYKDDLNALFKVAMNDSEKIVRDTATAANDKLNKA